MRVIIDTNILVSAAVADGKPERTINYIISGSNYEWIVSEEILAEYNEVLYRRKLKLSNSKRTEWLNLIKDSTKLIEVNLKVDFQRNSKDAKFIALAMVSEADFLITGDKDFSEMKELPKTVIVSVSLFYDLFMNEE
ncbi:MAG: putative toxin-antitoxin system toxin component, PIN family [Okeania sp. SIO3B3]|nr:putative toxin-antitoxin system toxin component, PIN family [Okeania sp. SIO3B3]